MDKNTVIALAQTLRTTANRPVKVSDVHGSSPLWSRSTGLNHNHLTARYR